MKLLIVSDSHGQTNELLAVMNRHRDEVDFIIHCGDSELPEGAPELSGVNVVKGNCDFHAGFPEELTLKLPQGLNLYVTHGHHYHVKMSPTIITYRGEEIGAQIVCYGHSHLAISFIENGILYINPGSLRLPRGRREATYCICSVEADSYNVNFYDINGKMIGDLAKRYARS